MTGAALTLASTDSSDSSGLLERLVRREPLAWGLVVRRHSGHVERVLRGALGADSELADLLQEVFLRAFRGIHRFRGGPDDLDAWLAGIAGNTARGCIRHRQARRFVVFRDPLRAPDPPANTCGPEVLRAFLRTRELIGRLPEAERTPFGLRFVAGFEVSEVAAACNVSVATAKRRLARARHRFERLGRRDPALEDWLPSEVAEVSPVA